MSDLKLNNEEIKQTELNILIEFDKYCRQNDLTYFLCGGTLLGAIRHKGFIPWDDDVDVFMPRKDYEKFKKSTAKNPIKPDLITTCYDLPEKSFFPFVKICDTTTDVVVKNISNVHFNIWIDVFPIDGIPEDEKLCDKLFKDNLKLKRKFRLCTNNSSYTNNLLKKILVIIAKPFYNLKNVNKFCEKMDRIASQYDYDSCSKVGVCIWGYGKKEIMNKSELKLTEGLFEGHKFYIPENYDYYLKSLYGNYMTLPPESSRITHQLCAYKR